MMKKRISVDKYVQGIFVDLYASNNNNNNNEEVPVV